MGGIDDVVKIVKVAGKWQKPLSERQENRIAETM